MSERKLVTENQLHGILNDELSNHEECVDCEITGPLHKVVEIYPDGGNWNRSLTIRGRPKDPEECGATAAEVIIRIAARFNLE